MKYLKFIFVILFLINLMGVSLAEWSYEIKAVRQLEDTLYATVYYYNGTNNETIDIPIFQPNNTTSVMEGIKNRINTLKEKHEAIARIKNIKPEIEAEINATIQKK